MIHILSIFEESQIQSEIKTILDSDEYKVISCKSGQEGLQFAATGQPDIILIQLQMSEIGGIDLVIRLKTELLTRKIPVIIIAENVTHEYIELFKKLQNVGCLLTPLKSEILIQKIESIVKDRVETISAIDPQSTSSKGFLIERIVGRTIISIRSISNAKQLLDDVKKLFSKYFIEAIAKDHWIFDLRQLSEINDDGIKLFKTIFAFLPQREIIVIAGRNYGPFIQQDVFNDSINLFISYDDAESYIDSQK